MSQKQKIMRAFLILTLHLVVVGSLSPVSSHRRVQTLKNIRDPVNENIPNLGSRVTISKKLSEWRRELEPEFMPPSAPTLIGLSALTVLVFGLASPDLEAVNIDEGVSASSGAIDVGMLAIEGVLNKVVDQELPNSLPDMVALTVSESAAGGVSALFLFFATTVFGP